MRFLGISQRGLMEPKTEPEHVIVDFNLEKAFEPRINTDYQRIADFKALTHASEL